MLYLREELSGWIAQLDQRGRERDRAFVPETWDGDGDFTFDRVGRGTVYARSLCLPVFGGLQPARLQECLGDAVTGWAGDEEFVQRFHLLVWPDVQPSWKRRIGAAFGSALPADDVVEQQSRYTHRFVGGSFAPH